MSEIYRTLRKSQPTTELLNFTPSRDVDICAVRTFEIKLNYSTPTHTHTHIQNYVYHTLGNKWSRSSQQKCLGGAAAFWFGFGSV